MAQIRWKLTEDMLILKSILEIFSRKFWPILGSQLVLKNTFPSANRFTHKHTVSTFLMVYTR